MINPRGIQDVQSESGLVDGTLLNGLIGKIQEILQVGIPTNPWDAETIRSALKDYDLDVALRFGSEGEPKIFLRFNAEFPLRDVLGHLFPAAQPQETSGLITRASECLAEGKLKWSATAGMHNAADNGLVFFSGSSGICVPEVAN